MDLRSKFIKERNLEKEVQKSAFIMDVTEKICKILVENNITRQELAGKLGKSKGFVSQILNGSRNMTLNTLADVCIALGYTPEINLSLNALPVEKTESNIVYLQSITTAKPKTNYKLAM